MMSPVQRINSLIQYLPVKDIDIAERFINIRDFDSLKELVDSALFKVKRSQNSENPKEVYKDISIEDLTILKAEVDNYVMLLNEDLEEYLDEY